MHVGPLVAVITVLSLVPITGEAAPVRHAPAARVSCSSHVHERGRGTPSRRSFVVSPACVRVHDGDTFYVGPDTIRLRGIDTPELGRPLSAQATWRLTTLLRSGWVTIRPRAEDRYGRTLADVYVNGWNVADVLRREGYSKPRSPRAVHRSATIGRP